MKAIKANRAYTITKEVSESFRKDGYDIVDDNGKVIAHGVGKVVSYEKYAELLEKYEALEAKYNKLAEKKSKKSE